MSSTAAIVPGDRGPDRLTTFGPIASTSTVRDEPSTMDLITIAERQREGGGAPSQRRPAGVRMRWSAPGGQLHGLLVAMRMLFVWRLRTNHV